MYDNYDAINVDNVKDIPVDYDGCMGVPIIYLSKHVPNKFEILGYSGGVGWNDTNKIQLTKIYENAKQHNPYGSVVSGSKINTRANMRFDNLVSGIYYTASNSDGYIFLLMHRLINLGILLHYH